MGVRKPSDYCTSGPGRGKIRQLDGVSRLRGRACLGGLKKGEKVEKINGPIRFVSVRREPLWPLTKDDVARERFPEWAPSEFAALFAGHNCCDVHEITSIEFSYVEETQ
jgi:hypothetical protein